MLHDLPHLKEDHYTSPPLSELNEIVYSFDDEIFRNFMAFHLAKIEEHFTPVSTS